jgi:hypothetical protein
MNDSIKSISDEIREKMTGIIDAYGDSAEDLRERIYSMLKPIPMGTVLSDDEGEVCRIVKVCAGASQWDRGWDVTLVGRAVLSGWGRIMAVKIDRQYWDGNNMHWRTPGIYTYVDREVGEELGYEPSIGLRKFARRVPGAVAKYLASLERGRAKNDSCLA